MVFRWWKRRRRRKLCAQPFPTEWDEVIAANVKQDRHLSNDQRGKLRQLIQVFVAEKYWEGCGGLTVTEEMKVTIAALACLLVVGMHEEIHFDDVLSILVYPTEYVAPHTEITRAGVVVDEGGQLRLGEAWWRGPVVLSWSNVLAGGRREVSGGNLVFHEFAHQLDMMNGRMIDGIPPLASRELFATWKAVMEEAYQTLKRQCAAGRRHMLDCYGTTNVAEFFACITEAFFENPHAVSTLHPHLYELLRDYYGLDPATWSR